MKIPFIHTITLIIALSVIQGGSPAWSVSAPVPAPVRLAGHVPSRAIVSARLLGGTPGDTPVSLAFVLPLRNQGELQDLLRRLYDPSDPLYGHYLTPQEFTERFGPAQADYDAVAAYARGLGFTVSGTHSNRALLDVTGSVVQAEAAFNLHLHNYQAPDGRIFHAPDSDPEVPGAIASRLGGVIGLDNSSAWHAHNHPVSPEEMAQAAPLQIGTGPNGGLAPADIMTAYNLNGLGAVKGGGQILGLFELDGYTQSDVSNYVSHFGLAAVPLQNVLVDGFSGRAGTGADEVTLDIELQIALAPDAAKIIVYEGPNTSTGVVDTYNRIATDNLAKAISTSWGLSELQSSSTIRNAENSAFMQMAAQGQSIFAASGDSGAYDNRTTLSVDDPGSQPYMVGVGGTQLFVNSGETYNFETTWNVNGTVNGGAGGGGISAVWTIPSWQVGLATPQNMASSTMRNVPDVSLNADQYTGYAIFYNGGWTIYGGTSCAAPLWAAFTARVNQQLAANGAAPLGFANPVIYPIARGANYTTDFHDIADGSTNLYYPAVTGYDDATGWGSFNGANLFADLAPSTIPSAPTGLTAASGSGTVTLNWTASPGTTSYSVFRSTTTGGEGSTQPVASDILGTVYTDSSVTGGNTYYYEVKADNSAGASGFSTETSATPSAPSLTITSGPTATTGKTFAQVQWTTNIAANSVVKYGTSSTNLSSSISNSNAVTAHSLKLTPLARRTTYYYQVFSTAGNVTVYSQVKPFTTQ